MTPSEFWVLTPWQFFKCLEGYRSRKNKEHDSAAWMMWHNALLSGASGKNFPKLEKFMSSYKKPSKSVDEGAIMGWLKAYSKRYKKEVLETDGSSS